MSNIKQIIADVKEENKIIENMAFELWLKDYISDKLEDIRKYDRTLSEKMKALEELDIENLKDGFKRRDAQMGQLVVNTSGSIRASDQPKSHYMYKAREAYEKK